MSCACLYKYMIQRLDAQQIPIQYKTQMEMPIPMKIPIQEVQILVDGDVNRIQYEETPMPIYHVQIDIKFKKYNLKLQRAVRVYNRKCKIILL